MIFKTTHQKKSAIITTIFMIVVLFLMFFCGISHLDPPEEYGVAINFGTSDVGSGEPKLNESIKSDPVKTETSQAQEEVVPEKVPLVEDEVLTQETDEAPVLENKKTLVPKKEKVIKKKVIEKKPVKKIEKVKPTPNKATQNALNNLFGKKSEGETAQSEGDDKGKGVKGSLAGDPNSNKYYGNDGSGGDGNYLLKGRKALSKPINKPNCNEEGVVVVRIEVDKNGKVIRAVAGVKGTTNNNPCLLEPAKKAALATKWNPDGNAPNKQVGLIRYKFILSE